MVVSPTSSIAPSRLENLNVHCSRAHHYIANKYVAVRFDGRRPRDQGAPITHSSFPVLATLIASLAIKNITQVHKANSLEHLTLRKRPSTAGSSRSSRPGTAMTRSSRPGSAVSRPPTVASTVRTARSDKTEIRKLIEGDEGPPMIGVTTYPYTRLQREYLEDFESLAATTLDHPYMATTAFNVSSVPHDLLFGSNFDDDKLGGIERKWKSEHTLAYYEKSIVASKKAHGSGVRSEQFQFLG